MPADFPAGKADPDYLYFLQHVLPGAGAVADSCVLEEAGGGGSSPAAVENGKPPAAGSRPSRGRTAAAAAAETPSYENLAGIDEDYLVFLRHINVVDDRTVLKIGDHVVTYEGEGEEARCGGGGGGAEGGVKDMEEDVAIAASGDDGAGEEKEKEKGIDSDEPTVIVSQLKTWDWREDPAPRQKVHNEDAGALLHRSHLRTPETANRGTSNGYKIRSHVISGSEGVIWPAHINQRPDTDFKRRLIHVLRKPITQKEYMKLFDMASLRTPLVKLRQVRNDEKFYDTDSMGNSYFDHYPDLVKQVSSTGLSNGLALMRGLFFWLENAAHDDQFMPWVDGSKEVEVIPLMD